VLVNGDSYGSVDAASVAALRLALAAQPTAAPAAVARENAPVAAIICGVMGAALVAAAAALLLLRWQRRRRRAGADAAKVQSPHITLSPLASADDAKARALARASTADVVDDDGSGGVINPLHAASRSVGGVRVGGSGGDGGGDAQAKLRKAALAAFSQRAINKDASGSSVRHSYAVAASAFAAIETPHVNPLRASLQQQEA
jgi:hypothetical protein